MGDQLDREPALGRHRRLVRARDGRLLLPPIPVEPGTNEYTWGEDPGDPMLDLVNSVRFKMHDVQSKGDVSIALLSPLRDDLPALPEGHRFIGVWSFDAENTGDISSMDLQVRYDDAMAHELGLSEDLLKLWQYDPAAGWQRLDHDPSFYRDPLDHLLTATTIENLTYFAVSAPEPGGDGADRHAGVASLRRRRS